jgi:hypothetical protein
MFLLLSPPLSGWLGIGFGLWPEPLSGLLGECLCPACGRDPYLACLVIVYVRPVAGTPIWPVR